MKLPPSFFYKFFKENSFFVVDNIIYIPTLSSGEYGSWVIGQKRFNINKGLKLSKLEEIYLSNHDQELKRHGNLLLEKLLKDEKEIDKDYHRLGQNIELVEFMIYDVLKKGKGSQNIKIIHFQSNNCHSIDKLFNRECFVWKGKIYNLNRGRKYGIFASINNKDYWIGERFDKSLEKIEEEYQKAISKKNYENLTKGQDSLLNKIEKLKEKRDIIELIKKGEYFDEEQNKGFKTDNNEFFATTKTRKSYVLREKSNEYYYRFGQALIGVKLTKQSDSIRWHDPVVINSYIHPALPRETPKPYQKICNGDRSYSKEVQGKSIDEAVKRLLNLGKEMIEEGYFSAGRPHHKLHEDMFQHLKTRNYTPEEVTNK